MSAAHGKSLRGLTEQSDFKEAFLEGGRVILRPIEKKDVNDRYLSWINDPEIVKWTVVGAFPTSRNQLKDYYNNIARSRSDVMFAVLEKRKKLHIGNIKLGEINWVHRFADLGIMIGDKRYWGRGYGEEATRLLLEYAFDRLNLNKVTLGVCAIHKPAIKMYKKAGFRIEGRMRNLLRFEGKYMDRLIMGISSGEWRSMNAGAGIK